MLNLQAQQDHLKAWIEERVQQGVLSKAAASWLLSVLPYADENGQLPAMYASLPSRHTRAQLSSLGVLRRTRLPGPTAWATTICWFPAEQSSPYAQLAERILHMLQMGANTDQQPYVMMTQAQIAQCLQAPEAHIPYALDLLEGQQRIWRFRHSGHQAHRIWLQHPDTLEPNEACLTDRKTFALAQAQVLLQTGQLSETGYQIYAALVEAAGETDTCRTSLHTISRQHGWSSATIYHHLPILIEHGLIMRPPRNGWAGLPTVIVAYQQWQTFSEPFGKHLPQQDEA